VGRRAACLQWGRELVGQGRQGEGRQVGNVLGKVGGEIWVWAGMYVVWGKWVGVGKGVCKAVATNVSRQGTSWGGHKGTTKVPVGMSCTAQ